MNLGTIDEYPTLRLATRAAEPYFQRINSPAYRPRHTGTLADFIRAYEQDVLTQLQPSTQSAMRSVIAKQITPALGHLRLHEIQPEVVQGWVAGLNRSGLSAKTVRNCFVALRSIWRSLRSWNRVQHDTFTGVVLPRIHQKPQRSFSADEVRRIIAASDEPYRTLYWLAAEAGVRSGELCGLVWASVDCERWTVTISQALSLRKIRAGKSPAAKRVIAISESLAAHLATRKGDGWVFPSRAGTPLIGDMIVKRHLKPLCSRLGIEPGGMHAFRHFQASIMDTLNAPTSVRTSRLGHQSLAVTSRYTHMDSADERRIAGEIADQIVPAKKGFVAGNCDQNVTKFVGRVM